MLSARAIAALSDELIYLYSQLEFEIKKDMFRRLNRLQKVTEATKWQAQILNEAGGLNSSITKLLQEYNEEIRETLKTMFYETLKEATTADLKYYGFNKRKMTESQKQRLNSSIDRLLQPERINKTFAAEQERFEKLYNSICRMTLTVAAASEKEFLRACNNAYMKTMSGAFSWSASYKTAVNEQAAAAYSGAWAEGFNKKWNEELTHSAVDLAENGVKAIIYDRTGTARKFSIEAATRMNILTGINQTASQQTLENAQALGSNFVEVSAHIGARNRDDEARPWANHEAIQGKIYAIEGEADFINSEGKMQHAPNFAESCGLGEPDGIGGINCRHSFYPYFAGYTRENENGETEIINGAAPMYSRGELDEMKDKRVTLDGEKITPYEAEQKMRAIEREIRGNKARAQALELTGNTDDPLYKKTRENIYRLQARARDIVDQTGIERKYINEYIGTKNGQQPRGLKPQK